MLISKWSDADAQKYIEKYEAKFGQAVALRTYSARLIGQEPTLVLHGGGNTSVKAIHRNIIGKEVEALYVKGSGWDLGSIEPEGHPGLDLQYLRSLRALRELSDEDMVNELRTHLFQADAPTPSVETLLHAFLPATFIDHSHANAILTLTNTQDAEEHITSCFGKDLVIVPYVPPGFELARLAAGLFDKKPDASGMLLVRHGLFSFGKCAKESYEKHLELVNKAAQYVQKLPKKKSLPSLATKPISSHLILPALRGALAIRGPHSVEKRFVITLRQSPEILDFVSNPELLKISHSAPITPDHTIRTKPFPLVLDLDSNQADTDVSSSVTKAISSFASDYDAYFERSSKEAGVTKIKLDNKPRVALIPGLGLIGIGETFSAASIAADIYEHTIAVKSAISAYSTYQGLPEDEVFKMEYWSLEQAKLGKQKPKALQGRVALITGGAGAIGVGIAKVLKAAGAEVVITDLNRVAEVARELGVFGIEMDVTSQKSVHAGFEKVIQRYGGVDIVVPNAGVALSAAIENISEENAHRVMEINFHGYLNTIQEATRCLKLQNSGGHLILISSKNVAAPGKEFAIYSASKAAGHQLGRVAALELAPFGVKVNMITPDAVFGSSNHPSGLWASVGPERAKARGMDMNQLPDFYRDRNLLKSAVSAEDVGRAVLFFASDQTPTTGAVLPVDGGIAEAFSR